MDNHTATLMEELIAYQQGGNINEFLFYDVFIIWNHFVNVGGKICQDMYLGIIYKEICNITGMLHLKQKDYIVKMKHY